MQALSLGRRWGLQALSLGRRWGLQALSLGRRWGLQALSLGRRWGLQALSLGRRWGLQALSLGRRWGLQALSLGRRWGLQALSLGRRWGLQALSLGRRWGLQALSLGRRWGLQALSLGRRWGLQALSLGRRWGLQALSLGRRWGLQLLILGRRLGLQLLSLGRRWGLQLLILGRRLGLQLLRLGRRLGLQLLSLGRRLLAVLQLSSLGRRLLAVLVVSILVGAVSAGVSTGRIGLVPPKLTSTSSLQSGVASNHVLIDARHPPIVQRGEYPFPLVIKHAELLGRVMTSPPLVERIGRLAGVDPGQITASVRSTVNVPTAFTEPSSEQRADEIRRSRFSHRLEIQARQSTPVLDIAARAPSTEEAEKLADSTVAALRGYLNELADREGFDKDHLVVVRQLSAARGGPVDGGNSAAIGLLAFALGFLLSAAAMLYWLHRRGELDPLRSAPRDPRAELDDDWPHTTRALPWMLAGFIAMLFLVPFDQIQLGGGLPIDLNFDRIVLPLVVVTWGVALMVGGRAAPRVRLTWIHGAVAAFVVCAFASVILNASDLSHTLELQRAVKQAPLLIAYVSLFVIAASTVRPAEIRAFLNYTLVLAVICALGVLFEFRFKQNLFYDLSDMLLPGGFSVERFEAGAVDELGRIKVSGPTALPLEAVATLTMALPIAVVGLLHARRWRGRLLYGLAACLLLAATFATYRKSAILAPFSVFLTVAYFRRRELLKLAPLALVLVVMIPVLAPGALRSTTNQLDPSRLGVATVSDRTADYDAVRPDIWSHLLLGRGWGTYDHFSYRVLDSELLHRLVEMGVVGLLAFIAMGLVVILSARATIAARDPRWAPPALIGAAAATSFLAVSVLFDVLSFPHPTYIFMLMAGLVTVAIQQGSESEKPRPIHPRGYRRHATASRTRSSEPAVLAPFAGRREG